MGGWDNLCTAFDRWDKHQHSLPPKNKLQMDGWMDGSFAVDLQDDNLANVSPKIHDLLHQRRTYLLMTVSP